MDSTKREHSSKPHPPHLFLCHSHKDKRFVRRLAEDLTSLSTVVWFDEWQLEPGDSLHECIGRALEESGFVGVILSPDSIQSRWCRAELDQALTREKRTGEKVVLPLLHRRISIPPFLESRLHLNFSRSYFKAVTELTGILHGLDRTMLKRMLINNKPRNLLDVKQFLSNCPNSPFCTALIPEETYQGIMTLFQEAGINIRPDMFELNTLKPELSSTLGEENRISLDEYAERLKFVKESVKRLYLCRDTYYYDARIVKNTNTLIDFDVLSSNQNEKKEPDQES